MTLTRAVLLPSFLIGSLPRWRALPVCVYDHGCTATQAWLLPCCILHCLLRLALSTSSINRLQSHLLVTSCALDKHQHSRQHALQLLFARLLLCRRVQASVSPVELLSSAPRPSISPAQSPSQSHSVTAARPQRQDLRD